MKREIIKIDEDLCNGCGNCVPICHEGALQIIDGKARLISDLMCDGLGACIGHCPEGAISIEEREAEAYDEVKTISQMLEKGENTLVAHLTHMIDHNELVYFNQGVDYLQSNKENINLNVESVIDRVNTYINEKKLPKKTHHHGGSCPGSAARQFNTNSTTIPIGEPQASALTHWPVQLHLINPASSHFTKSDLLIAADCTAFSMGSFHSDYLQGKTLIIACPKLDSNIPSYVEKIQALIDDAMVNTITITMMEVPCCHGLLQIVKEAQEQAERKVPVKAVIVSVQGKVLQAEWI